MAEHKDFGLSGVNRNLQLGKQGPQIKNNGDGTISVTDLGGSALVNVLGANAIAASHFVTKAQMDTVVSDSSADSLQLGASVDASWTDGAVQSLTNSTTVTEAIDKLNESMENVRNDTFVKSVDATVDVASGGTPLTSTLTLTTVGNPNRYTIDWGDGNSDVSTTDTTPSHTYENDAQSPFTVVVTAFNNSGAGEGSTASVSKTALVTLFTGDPVVDFAYFGASSGGSAITNHDAGDAQYLENTTTNIGGATIQYTIDWGDSQSDTVITDDTADGGSAGDRLAHTFDQVAETDQTFTTRVTLDSHSSALPASIPTNTTLVHKQYATHTPSLTASTTTGINEEGTSGLPVTFTNTTEATIGSYADYGIIYKWTFGDGTVTPLNTGSGTDGDTGETISHTYELSSSDQANGVAQDYTGTLEVISEHASSPFVSTSFAVHVEPDVRANQTATAINSNLNDASGDNDQTLYLGTDLSGNNRAIITIDNTSQNGDSYTFTYGDGNDSGTINESGAPVGSVAGANITYDYGSVSAGSKTLSLNVNGTPDITAQTDVEQVTLNVKAVPSAPAGLSSKSLTWNTSYVDGGRLASGATNNTGGTAPNAGDSVQTSTFRRFESGTIRSNTVDNVYNGASGTLSAVTDSVTDGTKTFSTSTDETGTFSDLNITGEGDARDQLGSSYPRNFYQVFDARISSSVGATGIHKHKLLHDATGATNEIFYVADNVTSTPTINTGSASVVEGTAGTYRYISGIPYYNSGSPTVTVTGLTVDNFVGECYEDSTTDIVHVNSGTNYEGTSSTSISGTYFDYSEVDGTTTMLSGSTPIAQTGVGGSYAFGDLTVSINGSSITSVETLKVRARNVTGMSGYASDISTKVQVHTASPSGVIETTIPVADSLGATHDDDGLRVTGFSGTGDTPAIAGATNFYTSNAWSGAVTVAGTSEAIVRLGTLEHYDTDLSSGYLPAGPDLSTGRSGAQYFTFAFRRTTMANFTVTLSGTISGMFIAAPGTGIDGASTLSGWLDSSITYNGAGTPGADTGNGGNGSNGCAFTSGDRVVDGNNYNNTPFTFTLGDQNATNSTGNNILVRIKLEAGDSITALSIA